jgi:two-component system cell cycle response regulator DivK
MKNSATVLVVEDNRVNLLLASRVVANLGFGVDTASSAEEAREKIDRTRPDVVLMDIQLPGLDGLAFTRELKGAARTAGVAVIALTSRGLDDDRRVAQDAGCDGYLTKPLKVKELGVTIEEVLQHRRGAMDPEPARDAG